MINKYLRLWWICLLFGVIRHMPVLWWDKYLNKQSTTNYILFGLMCAVLWGLQQRAYSCLQWIIIRFNEVWKVRKKSSEQCVLHANTFKHSSMLSFRLWCVDLTESPKLEAECSFETLKCLPTSSRGDTNQNTNIDTSTPLEYLQSPKYTRIYLTSSCSFAMKEKCHLSAIYPTLNLPLVPRIVRITRSNVPVCSGMRSCVENTS